MAAIKHWAWFLVMVFLRATATARAETVCLIKVEGVIGPATASYISRAVDEAASKGAQCLIIQLDTPGGLLDPTKETVQKFLASTVPTVVYVAPQGAQAASAGCFITLAADVAAMGPATAIGAAHPVELSGSGEIDKTMKEKLENFYSRYIESIAVKRKRNAEWAKSSVRDSASTTSEKALQLKVIDFIAKDREDLLKQLDGREVNNKKLKTASATVVEIPMSMREKVFQAIAHPQMMLVLMLTLIVTYEITGELTRHFPYETCPATIAGHSVSLTGIVSSLTVLSSRFSTPRPACGLRVKWFLPSSCVPRRFSTERRQNVASSTSPRDCRPAGLSPAVVWATSATQSLPKMARNAPSKDEV